MAQTVHWRRVALITGANKGIGFETARQLGKQGITALVGSRGEQAGQKAVEMLRGEGIDARLIVLDVTDQATIDRAVTEVDRDFGRLDILVSNAGVLLERLPPSECQVENLRQTFETNVFGLFAVTKAFLPLLHKSPAARIVNVSSALGSLAIMSDSQRLENKYFAYCLSKAAVNMMTIMFARELAGTRIKVNAVTPGYTATAMNNFTGTQTVEQGAVALVRMATLPEDGPNGSFVEAKGSVAW